MDTSLIGVRSRQTLLEDLDSMAAANLSKAEVEPFKAFVRRYLDNYPMEDWESRQVRDLYSCCVGLWYFLKQGPGESGRVKVFNPNLDEHDWECGRTVIHVLQADMPFLVDSIRLELRRRELAIHLIKSTVMPVARDSQGKLVDIQADTDEVDAAEAVACEKEALVYVEVNLLTGEEEHTDIANSLLSVLKDVAGVVEDYYPMLTKVSEIAQNLDQHASDTEEALAFLSWMPDAHFTFLGYREFDYLKQKGKEGLREKAGSRLGIFKKLPEGGEFIPEKDFRPGMSTFYDCPDIVYFSKSSTRSNVHRSIYPDYIVVKKFDEEGQVCGEVRFLGLFTYSVYTISPTRIPIVRQKTDAVMKRSGLDPAGHDGKNLRRVIENFPRDELFQSDETTLFNNVMAVASINERHIVRVIMREDPFGHFVNCMVYVPRESYNTQVRIEIENLIGSALDTSDFDSTTYFSESALARAQFIFKVDPDQELDYDVKQLEAAIVDITRGWKDHLQASLIEHHGETRGIKLFSEFKEAFSQGYQESFDARTAVHDIEMLMGLESDSDLAMNFYHPVTADTNTMYFKIMHLHDPVELSDVIPILENLGLRVLGEHPFKIKAKRGVVWLHDFELTLALPITIDVHAVRNLFEQAFSAIWRGKSENDPFNKLVLGARLNWREVYLLRTYARYMKQTAFNSSHEYIADTLSAHPDITRNIVALFKAFFDPRVKHGTDKDEERIERLSNKILDALDGVANLNEDKVLRRYYELLCGTLRTNFFQQDSDGNVKTYISIKFSPRDIPDIPEPRPLFEIFVYSPRMEGVHLRGGKVARGGLRWSDRLQDYRTEVLGLVKAQQVKNAVIVPNGAKGGFVAKNLNAEMTRDEFQKEGVACYKIFIQGLLDITDNLVEGKIIPPENVRRRDSDDPYLVVAADKGTATFSDIANEISNQYNHWLGDAFASGGSQGYDHKGMGITARGGWVSVQRHFREKGIDIQSQDFTVVGIGDMSGDVFGNGMLLSQHICLVGAFNHMHIFIDPTPDAKKTYAERKRLFEMPRSSWADFNSELISKGGGIFPRTAKSIKITPEMKDVFAITEDRLAPSDLISALLKAPVDLLWNGGIGTYVKASGEAHSVVGDKANDSLRVNGRDLRCKVVGEGGNLGMTQLGRVEYCLNGGACNTDFIDNAGGVDCSDHEVNIKILLDELVSNGELTVKHRNQFLAEMTDEVAGLVLQNNYRQTQAISIAEHQALARVNEYRRFINFLEAEGRLDRQLEFLPSDEEIVERQGKNKSLARPELAILISYAKVMLKEILGESSIADDDYVAKQIETAFPLKLRSKYKKEMYSHRLRREIVGTQVANDFVNNLGITAAHRLLETTGANLVEIAKAYIIARDIFRMEDFQQYIKSLDNQVPALFQMEIMINMIRRVRRGTRWFLRNRRGGLDPVKEVSVFKDSMAKVQQLTADVLDGWAREEWQERKQKLVEQNVPPEWVAQLATPDNLFSGLGVVEASLLVKVDINEVAEVFFMLMDRLSLNWFATQLSEVNVESYWQAVARESFIDDLEAQLRKLTIALVKLKSSDGWPRILDRWEEKNRYLVDRWKSMVREVKGAQVTDYAMFSVALRELIDLTQATEHSGSFD